MDSPSYEEFVRRQQEQQEQHQRQQQQQQHHQQLPPLYSTSISGYLPQHAAPESQMRRDGENYLSDSPLPSYFGPYNGSSTSTAAPAAEPYAAYTAQMSSNLLGLRPQMSHNVSIAPQPPTQFSFMPPSTPSNYQSQPQSQPGTSHLVASMPMTSSQPQYRQVGLTSQPQQNYPPPQLQLDHTQFYGELNGVGHQQYAPVSPYQQPQVRTPYFTSFLNGEHAPQYLNSQTYTTYGELSGTGQGNVPSESVPQELSNAGIGALSSVSPADVPLSGVNQTDYRPVPHWPVPPITASPASDSAGVIKSEKKVTKRTAAATDAPAPKKKATKKTTASGSAAVLTATTVTQLPTVATAIDSTTGLVVQSALPPAPVPPGQNLAAEPTPLKSLPQIDVPSSISGPPPKPKELQILQEKDPVTALRLRVATAFRNLMDDMRLLTDRLVEIMLSIPEEAYGTTTEFDLREVYLSQLTVLASSTKDVWDALAESNLCLARIRNWLVYDYKSMRFDSAKPVLVALSAMPISTEQLKRVKMEKVLLFYEGKGNDACKALARKIRSRAKNVEDKDTLSEKPERSPSQETEGEDSKTVANATKKVQIPRTNPLSGFTIPKRSHATSSSTTAKVPAANNSASNPVKTERPAGNTSFFQSLQKKAAPPAKSATPKPAEEKKSVSSVQSSTPAPAAAQPRFSSLYTAFRTGPKSEDVSENSTPEPVRPRKKRKTVAWRSDADLVQVRYFESDPSERALNVSDTVHERYRNARELDISEGRAAFKKGNRIEDIEYEVEEDEKILWYNPIDIDFGKCERFSARELEKNIFRRGGSKMPESPEAVIQKERESNVLLAMYFTDTDIPASPSEPENEGDLGSNDSSAVKEIPVPQPTRLSWALTTSNGTSSFATTVSSAPPSATVTAPTQSSTAQGFATLRALLPFLAQAQTQTQPTHPQVPLSQPQQQAPDLTALAAMLQAAGGFYGTGKAAANGSAS
ncbi:hypothetical protein V1525DRAFT_434261 [Lipomyces kononenkoae]|uniref:Uncharacterized protein n=1 Tax=Lipomyces kononenkoae TaxID=34357 RepID=A0ACC3SWB9_LIPKO